MSSIYQVLCLALSRRYPSFTVSIGSLHWPMISSPDLACLPPPSISIFLAHTTKETTFPPFRPFHFSQSNPNTFEPSIHPFVHPPSSRQGDTFLSDNTTTSPPSPLLPPPASLNHLLLPLLRPPPTCCQYHTLDLETFTSHLIVNATFSNSPLRHLTLF